MFTEDQVVELCGVIIFAGIVMGLWDLLMNGLMSLDAWLWKRKQAKNRNIF